MLKYRIEPGDPLLGWSLEQLNNRSHRILTHSRQGAEPPQGFHQYRPDTIIQVGDTLSYIEVTGRWAGIIPDSTTAKNGQETLRLPPQSNASEPREHSGILKKAYRFFRDSTRRHFWRNPIFKITAVCLATVLILLATGSALFYIFGDGLEFSDAIYATVVLLLGGYPDLLGSNLRFNLPIPWWLRLLGLFFTLAGTFILGALYAVITGNILAARFQFVRRSRPPERDHVVLIGLGRVGRKVALLLNEFRQPLAALAQDEQEANLPQSLPVVFGNGDANQDFARTNLSTCKSVVALTDDEMTNLEICLNSRKINPACNLVLGTFHQRFNDHVARLFPYARALCASALAAEAFAAAAFGENVPSLFYQNDQTVLVTQYFIQSDDTLHGKLLADIAYGYGVLPIVLTQGANGQAIWMPSNDLRLNLGDHLTVLATSEGLRRVEKGEITPPDHQVTLEPADPSVHIKAARRHWPHHRRGQKNRLEIFEKRPGALDNPLAQPPGIPAGGLAQGSGLGSVPVAHVPGRNRLRTGWRFPGLLKFFRLFVKKNPIYNVRGFFIVSLIPMG